jgi:chaperonin GroES
MTYVALQRPIGGDLTAGRSTQNQSQTQSLNVGGHHEIPDTAKEKPSQGEVIAVGPGGRDESGKLIPIDLKVGDRVLFGKWSGTEVKIDGEDLLIMKESDIMGVLEENVARKKAA